MFNLKTLFVAGALTLGGASVYAQSNNSCGGEDCQQAERLGFKPYPYGFVQVQGGVGTTLTDVSPFKILSPTFSIAGGYQFSPIVGARLHVNGLNSKGGFDRGNDVLKYKYNYINTNADLMLNVINVFSPKCYHPLDLYLIGGVGLNYAWDNSEFEAITSTCHVKNDISNAWGDKQTPRTSLLGHNLRLGVMADYNINKNFSVGAEIDFNSLDDRFNSKYKDADDWMVTAQLSVTYKFGRKACSKPAPEPKPVKVVKPVETAKPAPQKEENKVETHTAAVQKPAEPVQATPKPAPVQTAKLVEDEPLKETVFYAIRESDVDKDALLKRVVAWCKKYPNKTITVDGYADKGTGNASLNVGYAQKRAQRVADTLKGMGVPASQMKVKSYGDKVQPFAENDKNRCVIIEGK